MADVWVIVGVFAFFGLCVLFVRACDLIIGPDDDAAIEEVDELDDAPAPVGTTR